MTAGRWIDGAGCGVAVAAALGVAVAAQGDARPIGDLARPMLPGIARCVIDRHTAQVTAWLQTLPGSAAELSAFKTMEADLHPCFGEVNGETITWVSQYDRPAMRAALIRALLQARREDLPLTFTGRPAVNWFVISPDQAGAPEVKAGLFANELGFCLAEKNWTAVRATVLTVDPDLEKRGYYLNSSWPSAMRREAERAAPELAKFLPFLSGCVPSGAKLTLSRGRLRNIVEEAAYHVVYPSGVSQSMELASENE